VIIVLLNNQQNHEDLFTKHNSYEWKDMTKIVNSNCTILF